MQTLTPDERALCVNTLADLLVTKQDKILDANRADLDDAIKTGLAAPLQSRLSLTPSKLKSLSTGLKQIADSSHQVNYIFYPSHSRLKTKNKEIYKTSLTLIVI